MDPISDAELEEWALAHLGRYASSAENLRRVLLRRARRHFGPDGKMDPALIKTIDGLVARYRQAGLLDDAAYAAGQIRRGLRRGRSLRRIAAGLAEKGIGADDAAAALAGLRQGDADPELIAASAFARLRHLGPFHRGATRPDGNRRALAAFARAGFERAVAEAILGCEDEEAVAALLGGGG